MKSTKRTAFGIGAILVPSFMAASLLAAAQNPGAGPGPFGGPGRPGRGGPGRFGGPGGPPPMGPGGPAMAGLERLGLSETQKDQVKTIIESHRGEMNALATREMTAREALNDAITTDVADEGLIRARSGEVAAVEADMAVTQARVRSEILQILTPEQLAQLKAFQAQMKQRQDERRQRRGQAPPR